MRPSSGSWNRRVCTASSPIAVLLTSSENPAAAAVRSASLNRGSEPGSPRILVITLVQGARASVGNVRQKFRPQACMRCGGCTLARAAVGPAAASALPSNFSESP